MDFHYSDFTEDTYRKLLTLALSRWDLQPVCSSKEKSSSICIWRHDVDVSLHRALSLAQIENEIGVKATYFIQLRSPFYNIFETPCAKIIKSILNLGHEVGLHFDPYFYEELTPKNSLWIEKLIYEKDILSGEIDHQIKSFSFHNPGVKGWNFLADPIYGTLINAYGEQFKSLEYCSDSNGYWRHRRLLDVLEDKSERGLYILTHPEWWLDKTSNPDVRIERAIQGRALDTKKYWEQIVDSAGRKVVFT